MVIESHELVKELKHCIGCLEHSVFGRLCKSDHDNNPYAWCISHHYRPSKAAAVVYYPSTLSAPSLEEAEQLLESCAGNFNNLDVKKNVFCSLETCLAKLNTTAIL